MTSKKRSFKTFFNYLFILLASVSPVLVLNSLITNPILYFTLAVVLLILFISYFKKSKPALKQVFYTTFLILLTIFYITIPLWLNNSHEHLYYFLFKSIFILLIIIFLVLTYVMAFQLITGKQTYFRLPMKLTALLLFVLWTVFSQLENQIISGFLLRFGDFTFLIKQGINPFMFAMNLTLPILVTLTSFTILKKIISRKKSN